MDDRVVSSPATIRVLNVLRYVNVFIKPKFNLKKERKNLNTKTFASSFRHWVSKHFQDFEQDVTLRAQTMKFLEGVTISPHLLPVEIRAASQLLRLLSREDMEQSQVKLQLLLNPPTVSPSISLFINKSIIIKLFYNNEEVGMKIAKWKLMNMKNILYVRFSDAK